MENHPNERHNTVIGSALSFAFNAFFSHILEWSMALLVMMLWFLSLSFIIGMIVWIISLLVVRHEFEVTLIMIPDWINSMGITTQEYVMLPGGSLSYVMMVIVTITLAVAYYLSAIHLGVRRTLINYYDKGEIAFRPVFNLRMIYSNVVASLVFFFSVIIGLILFIIPGIVILLRSRFFGFLIVDKNMGPIEAIQASWAMTKGKMNIMLGLLIMVIIFFTLMPIIGIFLVGLMAVYVYRAGLLK